MNSQAAHDLSARLADLLRREQAAMADFLLALADFDRKRLWLDLGYPGLFMFLHRELGLSKGAAHFRKVAAELVQRFPEVVQPLRDGRLCLTSVVELARVATRQNLSAVLPRFFHRSRTEAREVAAEISPAAVIPRREVTTIVAPAQAARVAATAAPLPATAAGTTGSAPGDPLRRDEPVLLVELKAPHRVTAPSTPAQTPQPGPAPEPPRAFAEPLTADLRRFHVTVSRRFLEKLERARSALSHSHRGAGAEAILEAGLDLLLAEAARRKGAARRPLKKPRPSGPDHVPAAVKRQVWARDGGRCQWPIAGRAGGVCGSTVRVELDHVEPRARGGPSTAEGMRLLCRLHNDLAARLAFGNRWMDQFTQRGGSGGSGRGGGAGAREARGAGGRGAASRPQRGEPAGPAG